MQKKQCGTIGKLLFLSVFSASSFLYPDQSFAALDRAQKAGFVPHQALYDIRLISKKSSAKVSNIHGKLMYKWQPSCDAWVSNHKFDMIYEYAETPAVRVTSEFSTYETFDGKSFDYTSQRKAGGALIEEVRGRAENTDAGQVANYTRPQELTFDLPEGTLYPMAHTLDVLEKIKAGKVFYKATIFDGSDEEGPVDVNSFIGKEVSYTPPEEYKNQIDEKLVNVNARNVRLAFFPLNKYEETADYEMSLVFHDNGVISDMVIDYDDFSIAQKLIAIEPTDNVCEEAEGVKKIQQDVPK